MSKKNDDDYRSEISPINSLKNSLVDTKHGRRNRISDFNQLKDLNEFNVKKDKN